MSHAINTHTVTSQRQTSRHGAVGRGRDGRGGEGKERGEGKGGRQAVTERSDMTACYLLLLLLFIATVVRLILKLAVYISARIKGCLCIDSSH